MTTLTIKVVPGASRNRIIGMLGDALKIAVTAAPEKGKANAAVVAVLAEFLSVPRSQISVVGGHTRPHKTVKIEGMTPAEVAVRLKALGV